MNMGNVLNKAMDYVSGAFREFLTPNNMPRFVEAEGVLLYIDGTGRARHPSEWDKRYNDSLRQRYPF